MLATAALPAIADGPATPPASPTETQREASALLAGMTEYLAGLAEFSVVFRAGYDVVQASGQKIEFGETRRVSVARPDRLRIEEVASDGRRDLLMFDGQTISALDADAAIYAQVPQPGSVDESLVYTVRDLRLRTPLALLLSTQLPQSLPSRVKTIDYVERSEILGVPAHHIAGRAENVDFQFWIDAGSRPLPLRVVITYVNSPGQPQFWANFAEWNTQARFAATTFDFVPPKDAQKVPFAVQVRRAGEAPRPPTALEGGQP
jgi:hypothetical protein